MGRLSSERVHVDRRTRPWRRSTARPAALCGSRKFDPVQPAAIRRRRGSACGHRGPKRETASSRRFGRLPPRPSVPATYAISQSAVPLQASSSGEEKGALLAGATIHYSAGIPSAAEGRPGSAWCCGRRCRRRPGPIIVRSRNGQGANRPDGRARGGANRRQERSTGPRSASRSHSCGRPRAPQYRLGERHSARSRGRDADCRGASG